MMVIHSAEDWGKGTLADRKYNFMTPEGETFNYASIISQSPFTAYPKYRGYYEAVEQYLAEGNEIIVADITKRNRGLSIYPNETTPRYTAALDDQGKVVEVEGSREITFSEWNSMSMEEQKKITEEVREQDKTFCQYQQRTLPPDFFARYEACPDKQLWVP